MKKYTYIIFILVGTINLIAQQNTYSRINDFGKKSWDLDLVSNNTVVLSWEFCELTENNSISCAALNKYDTYGNLDNRLVIDSIFTENDDLIYVDDNRIYLVGIHHRDVGITRPSLLYEYDADFQTLREGTIPPVLPGFDKCKGLITDPTYFYLCGTNISMDRDTSWGYLTKVRREDFSVVWSRRYPRSFRYNDFFDLQWTVDSNLVLINDGGDVAGAGGETGYEIMELDTAGQILYQYLLDDYDFGSGMPACVLSSSSSDLYFASDWSPLESIFFRGYLNKLNRATNEIEWSFFLPSDPFLNARSYNVEHIIETNNGDIVACGYVWDATDGGAFDLTHATRNGFIICLNPAGEMQWLRIYQIPSYIMPQNELGRYRPSFLSKIKQTPMGGFIAAGHVNYDNQQVPHILENSPFAETWLLKVDSVGCLVGEECEEVIVLDGVNSQASNFELGTKWTYEEVNGIGSGLPPTRRAKTFEITGQTTWRDTLVYVIEPGVYGSLEYMYLQGDSIYFWDWQNERFQLNFDFSANQSYLTSWSSACFSFGPQLAEIVVDSIREEIISEDALQVQYLTADTDSAEPLPAKVYRGIGNDYSLKIGLGEDCDIPWVTNKLRCFEDGENSYNFVGYPCDSMFIVSTDEVKLERNLLIYPNPSSGTVFIQHDKQYEHFPFQVYDLSGRIIQQGITQNSSIEVKQTGTFILVIEQEGIQRPYRITIQE